MYSNAQILAAILNHVGQPIIYQIMSSRLQNAQFVTMAENWVRNLGIAGPNWSLTSELMPFVEPLSGAVVEPLLARYISNVPDDMIPSMAHSIVDKAIKNGGMTFCDGNVIIDVNDLNEVKKLLNANMPFTRTDRYVLKEGTEVKNEPDDNAGADTKQPKHS